MTKCKKHNLNDCKECLNEFSKKIKEFNEKPDKKIYCDICSYPENSPKLYSLRNEKLEILGYIIICENCLKQFKIKGNEEKENEN